MSKQTFVEDRTDHQRTPYLFNGKELDKETGLYYYGARYYDPRISMFYGVDPMADKYAGYSPFAYAVNNPLHYIDPTGMELDDPPGGQPEQTKKKENYSPLKYDENKKSGSDVIPDFTIGNRSENMNANKDNYFNYSEDSDIAANGGGSNVKNYVEKANNITGNPLASFALQYSDDILRSINIAGSYSKNISKVVPGLNVAANFIGAADYGLTMADPNVRVDQKMLKTATTGIPLGLSTTSMILTGIGVGGSFATGIGEAAVAIGVMGAGAEKLYNDVIIPTYQNIENRLNSINWWGWQMGF